MKRIFAAVLTSSVALVGVAALPAQAALDGITITRTGTTVTVEIDCSKPFATPWPTVNLYPGETMTLKSLIATGESGACTTFYADRGIVEADLSAYFEGSAPPDDATVPLGESLSYVVKSSSPLMGPDFEFWGVLYDGGSSGQHFNIRVVADPNPPNESRSYTIDCSGSTSLQDGLTYSELNPNAFYADVELPGTGPVDINITLLNCYFWGYSGGPTNYDSGYHGTASYSYSFTVDLDWNGYASGYMAGFGNGRTYYIQFANVAAPELDVITEQCVFNGTKDLVINASPSVPTYSIREQGAGTASDTKTYYAWLEIYTPASADPFDGALAEVDGDNTIELPYEFLAAFAGIVGPTFTYKFFPVEEGDSDSGLVKSGSTYFCSITFNVDTGSGFTVQGLGYWKNEGLSSAELPTDLGDYIVDTQWKATGVFNATNCGIKQPDAVGCLAGHLLAAKFNDSAGADASCIADAIEDADDFLASKSYAGPGRYSLNKSDRSYALSLKNELENFNEYGCGGWD